MQRRRALRLLSGAAACGLAGRLGWTRAASPLTGPLAGAPAQMSSATHPLLPLFPLRVVLLPGNSIPLHIFEPRYREMIRECIDNQTEFGVLLMSGGVIEPVGCTARVSEVIHRYTDGRFDIMVRGERRFRIGLPGDQIDESDFNSERAFFRGSAAFFEDDTRKALGGEAKAGDDDALRTQAIDRHAELMRLISEDDPASSLPGTRNHSVGDPLLSFHLMDGLPADAEWKQDLLELRVERERLVRVVLHLQRLIEFMESGDEEPAPRRVARWPMRTVRRSL